MDRIGIFVCLFLMLGATASYSFDTPVTTDKDRFTLQQMGAAFQKIADKFECKQFSWANFQDPKHSSAQLEYVPEGTDANKWTRMVTINLYALTGDPAKDHPQVSLIVKTLMAKFKKDARVTELKFYNDDNNPDVSAAYIEYSIGAGDAEEHTVGIVKQTGKEVAAFVQVQARTKPMDPKDAALLRSLLLPGAK